MNSCYMSKDYFLLIMSEQYIIVILIKWVSIQYIEEINVSYEYPIKTQPQYNIPDKWLASTTTSNDTIHSFQTTSTQYLSGCID